MRTRRVETTTIATSRYHPGVIWAPFVLALLLGGAVSFALFVGYAWPDSPEPEPETPRE